MVATRGRGLKNAARPPKTEAVGSPSANATVADGLQAPGFRYRRSEYLYASRRGPGHNRRPTLRTLLLRRSQVREVRPSLTNSINPKNEDGVPHSGQRFLLARRS